MTPAYARRLLPIALFVGALGCGDSPSRCDGGSVSRDAGCDDPGTITTCRDRVTGRLRPVVSPAPGNLVITEFLADPSAVPDADGEWVEIFAAVDADLNSVEIRTGAASAWLRREECLPVTAGTYALLARRDEPAANGGLPPVLAELGASLANASGALAILTADGALIDQIVWTQQKRGVSSQLDPARLSPTANDEPSSFCGAAQAWSANSDLGSPGAVNPPCVTTATPTCIDPVTGVPRTPVAPTRGQLVISELMADPTQVTDSAGEWIELYARVPIDLNGVQVSSGAGGVRTLSGASCLRVPAGAFAVLARNREPALNGGITGAVDTFGFGLSQSAATIDAPHSLTLLVQGAEIDRMTWTWAAAGASTQLSATALGATPPDATSGFCVAPPNATYGMGDRGTPGAMNSVCP
ncbi:MAG TPA: hypothetical protein VE549_10365 [Myxococcaceae bacterium]|nr:hypothetical protein [Myxococcaceae bacterium]